MSVRLADLGNEVVEMNLPSPEHSEEASPNANNVFYCLLFMMALGLIILIVGMLIAYFHGGSFSHEEKENLSVFMAAGVGILFASSCMYSVERYRIDVANILTCGGRCNTSD